MNDAVELLMIRHGESVANLEQRFTKHDDEPLTELGVEQARATGKRLVEVYQPDRLFCSPFLRARITAETIGQSFGLKPTIVGDLYEQSFGEYKGLGYEHYFAIHSMEVQPRELWFRTPPGGESLRDVRERVGPALDELVRQHSGELLMVVSHGAVMAALRAHVRNDDYAQPPESTENAWGYRLVARVEPETQPEVTYKGPFELIP